MKQLKLGFNEINLLGDYDAAEVIDEGKFKHKTMHHSWSDTLSDDGKKIIYHEYTYDTDSYMDFENWIYFFRIHSFGYYYWNSGYIWRDTTSTKKTTNIAKVLFENFI